MTTAAEETNTTLQPSGTDPNAQPASGAAPDAGAPPIEQTGSTSFTSEDAELAAAEAQLAAEAKKADGQPSGTQPTGDAAASAAAAPAQDPAAKAAATSKNSVEGAVIALRKKAAELASANAILTGENNVLKQLVLNNNGANAEGSTDGGQPAQQEQTIEQQYEAIDAEYQAISRKVDDGELSLSEAEKLRGEVRKKERALTISEAEQRASAIVSAPRNDSNLETHVNNLVTDYPILNELSAEELEPFRAIAYAKAKREGNPIPEGAIGTMRLRESIAQLAENQYGTPQQIAAWNAARTQRKGGGAAPNAGGQQPNGSKPTADQREAKLRMAANMPPNVGNLGSGNTGGPVTVEQAEATLAGMRNEDEMIRFLDANPGLAQKVMGGSARVR